MNAEFFESLGFYVYAYLETDPELSSRYAYIGMGQGSRVIDHLKEDKTTEHPEFHDYLYFNECKLDNIVILASNLESKRTAEAVEHYLIQEYRPRLNRSPGNIRGADVETRSLLDAFSNWEKDQWSTKKQMTELLERYGIRIATDINDTRKSNSSVKFFTPTKNGVSRWASFEKIGVVVGMTTAKGVIPHEVIQEIRDVTGITGEFICKASQSTATYDHHVYHVQSLEEEMAFMEYIFNNQ